MLKNTFVILLLILFTSRAALSQTQESNLTLDQIKKIIKEELENERNLLKAKEDSLNKKEQELAAKENKLLSAESNKSIVVNDKAVTAPGPLSLEISGYGDIQADYYDHPDSENQHVGNRGQSKSTFDTQRFVLELEAKHQPSDLEIEAEIEFEHGGTGATREIEGDNFAETESEIEKGGEVLIEELYLQKDFGEGFSGKLGRFYIGLNTLSYYYLPTDYLAARRPEVEETMLPGQWDEIGISLEKELDFGKLTLQVVNGLDSTDFNSANWIAKGHQSSFEGVRAEDLAYVARVDVNSLYPGLSLGSAIYVGNTSGNRPQDDVNSDGNLIIGSANYRYWDKNFKTQGAFYLGHLSNAQEITEANTALSEHMELNAVAKRAIGLWTEVGYNISPYLNIGSLHELSPFFRFDHYDTFYDSDISLDESAKYQRQVYTLGLAYLYDSFLTIKINGTHREFGGSNVSSQDALGLGVGFVY